MYSGFAKHFFITILIVLVWGCQSKNQQKTAEFYVRANCEMCEERIEAAATQLTGVESADFNLESHQLSVTYDSTKISELEIHKAIANVGHGTKLVPMSATAHEKLPGCCKEIE
ncbi:MAG: cation transporter [Sporocytophaga sp.]|uniref:heavy-metal-associated domain-containing protein n=1 Tax=Sporocytophaga sp. TaxID=2231183 RepID=UPI001B0D5BBA|nr:heavy-metal-associated domain-containing protein [Sporocytophaga sp.]MBO9700499.1 cation transporter [Sporocytophaga sp.]